MNIDFDFEKSNPKSSSESLSGFEPIELYKKPEELSKSVADTALALFRGDPVVIPIDPLCPIIRKPGIVYPECPTLPPLKLRTELA